MRFSLRLFAPALVLAFAVCARADVIYNLTLTSTQGNQGGFGSFSVNIPPPATGTVTYAEAGISTPNPSTPGYILTSLDVTINLTGFQRSYTLSSFAAPAIFGPMVTFTNGVASPNFNGEGGARSYGVYSLDIYGLQTGGAAYTYTFVMQPGGGTPYTFRDTGTVNITPAAATAPEPSSISLLGMGLLSIGLAVRRHLA